MFERVKEAIVKHTSEEIAKIVWRIAVTVFVALYLWLFFRIFLVLPKWGLAVSAEILLLLTIALIAWNNSLRNRITAKLIDRFGIKWSKDGEPYCPNCDKVVTLVHAITNPAPYNEVMQCAHCQQQYFLTDDGSSIKYADAKSRIVSKS